MVGIRIYKSLFFFPFVISQVVVGLVFSWFYLPMLGGSELFIRAITDRLRGRYRFIVLAARMDRGLPALEESEHVTIRRVGLGTPLDKFLYPLFAIPRALRLPDVDLVHAVMVNAAGRPRLCSSVAPFRASKTPILDAEKAYRNWAIKNMMTR